MPPSMLPSVILSTSAPGTNLVFAAQWLAYALPCRRFADTLTDARARLGADVDRCSFIVVDLHHLLFAGFDRRTRNQKFSTNCEVPDLLYVITVIHHYMMHRDYPVKDEYWHYDLHI